MKKIDKNKLIEAKKRLKERTYFEVNNENKEGYYKFVFSSLYGEIEKGE